MNFLVTGAAGFIGFHTSQRLLADGYRVVGLDNLSPYYDVQLKQARLNQLTVHSNFEFVHADISDASALEELFGRRPFDRVIHLAAQAGVRYSVTHPHAYGSSNLVGFLNILEACRHAKVPHLVYASTSSVYGANTQMPFSVLHNVDHPVSLYAATKKANELMAHSYSHLYGLPTTGLRFFTVYGPWGRPDMALFKFTKAILAGTPIDIYNHGAMQRDFTYIDDIVEGIVRVAEYIATANPNWSGQHPDPSSSAAPYHVFNIGNNQPVPLLRFIEILEAALGRKAIRNYMPMQAGDVPATFADIDGLEAAVGYRPLCPIELGIQRFVNWYCDYYRVGISRSQI